MNPDPQKRAAAVYNAAADRYDSPSNSFWSRFGSKTVERIGLRHGDRVLDVCCGSGASALPAAGAVGPSGKVIGVDLCDNLLALAQTKAARDGLDHAEFRRGDMMALDAAEESFDAVVCVFGIFFVPDMPAAARSLWRAVLPGGTLAITTWGPRFFEPVSTVFWDAVREVRPDLYRGFNPWDRVSDPPALLALLDEAGISGAAAVAEPGRHPLPTPEAFWDGVLGSGYRGTVDQLSPADQDHVKRACFDFIAASTLDSVEVNVVYALARKTRT